MKNILEQTLLFDFYGELLTQHQKKIYSRYIQDDLSLSEIAAEEGISRQGVHDLIRRCDKSLEDYEQTLHLVARFLSIKKKVKNINQLLEDWESNQEETIVSKIKEMTQEIIDEL